MKRLFTLLIIAMVVTVSFAQPPIKVAYIGGADPVSDGDLLMPGYLEALGFDLTYFAFNVDNPVADYDVVVISEVPGSGDAGWGTYSTAPLPIVHFKVHALKSASLNWIATGTGAGGTDYDNSLDSVITVIDAGHQIMTGFTGTVQVVENVGAANEWNIGWINMPEGNGIKVVGQSGETEATHQAIVAIDAGTVLNPTVTLTSRAVVMSYHQACWEDLNDDAKTLMYNAIYWAASREFPVSAISNTSAIEASVFPNPSTGMVNVRFSEISSEVSVNVLSMDGRVVFTQQLANQSSSIDLSELNSGMYFINFEGADISYTEKLILK